MSKDFYSTVYEMNNHALLRTSVYHELVFYGTERVNSFLLDIVKNNRKVFVGESFYLRRLRSRRFV